MERKMTALDDQLVNPATFTDETSLHALWADLRRDDPVHWTEPVGYRPFWSISKHADIMEIERQHELFINDPRTTLATIQQEEDIKTFTGGSHILIRSLVQMDNPDHMVFRKLTQGWFMPPNLKKLQAGLADLAKEFVDRMEAKGGECDFVSDVAVWYPLRVIMMILGVPREDEPTMLRLTQELFGSTDADLSREDEKTSIDMNTVTEFFDYFTKLTEARRADPQDDVASIIANAEINGEPIGHLEAMSYYIIVATAGHDTTSSSTAGGLLALLENPDQLERLRANPDLLPSAIDEMIRWSTPVKHFMRTATADYELRGKTIKKGDSLFLFYPSGNRDEEVFDDPNQFNIDRTPNKHLAFGYGAHVCLGQHLAKMEIKALYDELLPRLDSIELAGDPSRVAANFVSGLKRLPIRYAMSRKAA
jgi:cytochrome P450